MSRAHRKDRGLVQRTRLELATAHGLWEVRAFLRVRCAHDPQAQRLAQVAERAANLLCPLDPSSDYAEADDDNSQG